VSIGLDAAQQDDVLQLLEAQRQQLHSAGQHGGADQPAAGQPPRRQQQDSLDDLQQAAGRPDQHTGQHHQHRQQQQQPAEDWMESEQPEQACQLHLQILYMGLTCYFLEYWLERAMGCAKARTRGKITAQPGRVVVTMELDDRAQHQAALALGIVLQESEEDGHLDIPSRNSSSSRLQSFVEAAALVNQYRLAGGCYPIQHNLWAAYKVGMLQALVLKLSCSSELHGMAVLVTGDGWQAAGYIFHKGGRFGLICALPPDLLVSQRSPLAHSAVAVAVAFCCFALSLTQDDLKAQLQARGIWPAWQSVWGDQQHQTLVYALAYIPGNTRVMSLEYGRSRSRNGTRVQVMFPDSDGEMQPNACEVLQFIELQPKRSLAAAQGSSSSSSSSATLAGQHGGSHAEQFAIVRRFNTVVRRDQPELARELMEAKVGDYELLGSEPQLQKPKLYIVALSDIVCALNACEVQREGVNWLQFPPHQSMSVGHLCELPSTVYSTY
jgi:hypothetical protein